MVFNKLKNRFKQDKNQPAHVVALDIGTEYVKALVGKVVGQTEAEQRVEIIGVGRQHQRLSDMQSGAISDIAGVVDNCDAALSKAEEMSGITARNTVIGIAGELVKGETATIKFKRPDPKKAIELPELEQIIEQVQTRALERARAQLAWESGVPDIEVKLVNAAVVNVFIDGYKVTNPLGFQGKDVSVQLFCAFAPMVHIGALERVAYDLDLNLVSVAAEPFAVAKSVGTHMSENFSAIFMDVGGGTTDIALVNDGGVEGTKMFGIGGRAFTRSVAQGLGITFEEAEDLKIKLSKGELADKEKAGRAKSALLPTVKVWLSGVELALSEFEKVDQLPSKIMLCGGGTGLPYILKALESQKWRANLPFTKDVSIAHITPDQVDRVVDTTNEVSDYTYITPMGLLNIGLDAILNGSTSSNLVAKLDRALQA